jgi:hypothetical protein
MPRCKAVTRDDVHEVIDKYKWGIDRVLLSKLLGLSFDESEKMMRGLMRDEPDTIFVNDWGNYITKENLEQARTSGTNMQVRS